MKERWGISGSHGFIGSHLVSELKKDPNNEVLAIDRFGYVPPNLDRLIDLASYGNMYDQTDPIRIYEANVMRVIDILNHATGIKSIILTSTSSVELPHQTLYSASKKAMEDFAFLYFLKNDLPILIARPLSVFGIGEQKEHLIPKLIDSCLNGTEMPFVGEPKHDFIYVDDFTNAIIKLSGPYGAKVGAPYRIGSGHLISNEEVKDIIEKVTGKKANLKRVKYMRSYDTDNWPCGENFSTISFEEGIRRMVNGK